MRWSCDAPHRVEQVTLKADAPHLEISLIAISFCTWAALALLSYNHVLNLGQRCSIFTKFDYATMIN